MDIIPQPKKVEVGEGYFSLPYHTKIEVAPNKECRFSGNQLKEAIKKKCGLNVSLEGIAGRGHIQLSLVEEMGERPQGYELTITSESVQIKGGSYSGVFYGVQTLKQLINQYGRKLPLLRIEDNPDFLHRGYYYDGARGKVPRLEMLKRLVDTIAGYKMNQLQIYIEHSFAYEGQSEIWSCTDPLTADELMELDDYCHERHIELIPSISTFGHLYEALRSQSYHHLCELEGTRETPYNWVHRMEHHTLDVRQSESMTFVTRMIDEFLPLFRSNKFNICADETFDLGEGKNKEYCSRVGKSKMYVDFLLKIIDHVKSQGKEVMFWGDIIIKHPEHIDDLPKDLICLNWWYWLNYPDEKVKVIADHGFRQYLCPGTNGWNQIMNDHKMAYDNVKLMCDYGLKYNSEGILHTDWGDFGHFNLYACSLPGMIYGAQFSWNNADISYQELNNRINKVEFHLIDTDLMTILHEARERQYMDFGALVKWHQNGDTKAIDNINISEADLCTSIHELKLLEERLLDLLMVVPEEKRSDLRELYVAIRCIGLANGMIPIVKGIISGKQQGYVVDPLVLAKDIEHWLEDYKAVWRRWNKESELYRIRDFFKDISNLIRMQS